MKSHRFVTLAALLLSPAFAQTNTSPFPSSGNVGIGTTNPLTPLHVVGPITAGYHNSTWGVDYLYGAYGSEKLFTIGSQYSSGASFFGFAVKAKSLAEGYASSTTINIGRSAIEADSNTIRFLTGSHQQSTDGGLVTLNESMRITNGNVGIGTTTPSARLEIANGGNATLRVGLSNNASNAHVQIRDSLHTVAYDANSRTAVGAMAWDHYNDGNNPSWSGAYLTHLGSSMSGQEFGVSNANSGRLIFQNCLSAIIATNGHTPIQISPFGQVSATFTHTGNVGIGTTNPQHKLSVNGTIKAKEVIVETTGWSDYVFANNYRLAPLSEVEAHITEKKHLPGIPSAAEVAENGVNVAQVQAALLAKVEELTLHLIAQEKSLRELKTENQALQKSQSALIAALNDLRKAQTK